MEVLARLHSLVAHVDTLDPEAAHKAEDGLARVVLRTIADGTCGDPREAARAMADMLFTDRDRWFA